jgi:hypothetical protein
MFYRKKYKTKFSTSLILKRIDKDNFKKNTKTKKNIKQERRRQSWGKKHVKKKKQNKKKMGKAIVLSQHVLEYYLIMNPKGLV